MEEEQVSDSLSHPLTHSTIRLQESSFSNFSTSSTLSPSFKVDEGYSDETRSQSDKELVATENVMMLPDWVLAQSESDRAAGVVERINPLLHMDPVFKLPPELTFEIFSYLDAATLLNATLASRSWRTRILDSGLWKVLYINEGWRADLGAIRNFEQEHSEPLSPQTRRSRPLHSESDIGEPKHKKRVPPTWLTSRSTEGQSVIRPNGQAHPEADNEGDHHMADVNGSHVPPSGEVNTVQPTSIPQLPSLLLPPLQPSLLVRRPNGTSKINWAYLYKQRRRLEANWHQGRFKNFQLPHPMHPEEAHRECVYAIQFQGKWLVSGSRDRTLRVWDLETKRLWHRPLVGHEKSVLCLQFDPSPEQDVIISGSSDRSVIVWKFSTGQKIHRISEAHTDSVLNLKFDHRYLVTCSKDRTVKVWNRKELSVTDEDYPRICKGGSANFPSHIIDLNEVAPSMLEAGLANSKFKSLAPYSLLMGIEGHGAAVNAMQLHGNEIVTASGDRMIKVWNVRTGACLKTLMGHEKGIACVQFDSRRIISGSNDNTDSPGRIWRPPGADEDLRREALEVENAFWKAQQDGAPVDLGRRALRRAGYTSNTAGSRDPRDISALGAKIPPGGGGSVWGRIVSGSYDESILIWHKDHDGVWSINHRLRQADAIANASADTLTPMARAAVSAQARQLHAQASGNMGPGPGPAAGPSLTPVPAPASTRSERESETEGMNDVLATPPHNNPDPGPAQAGEVAQPHQTNGQATPQADRNTIQRQQQLANAQMQAVQQLVPHHHHHHHQRPRVAQPAVPTSRVFKVQFDSRKIVCASVDPRIVGWDFANDDEDIIEACPFFESL
ncbi:hypothetical protein N7540_010870 [Penicillium herquei]|nr:hypothetical protein N7540_010870 [Penicillium herquei]